MGYKYHCDDCGKELDEWDNVGNQLDMTGHAYCSDCYPKHDYERKPSIYTMENTNPKDKFRHSSYTTS